MTTSMSGLTRIPAIAVIADVDGELEFVDEWIRFHAHHGVSNFLLFSNNPSVFEEKLEPWSHLCQVTLVRSRKSRTLRWWSIARWLPRRSTQWIVELGVREFLFCPDGATLPEKLNDFAGSNALVPPRRIFGSSGHQVVGKHGVLETFVMSQTVPAPTAEEQKPCGFRHLAFEGRDRALLPGNRGTIHSRRKLNVFKILQRGQDTGAPMEGRYSPDFQLNYYWARGSEEFENLVTNDDIDVPPGFHDQRSFIESCDRKFSESEDLSALLSSRASLGPYIFIIGFNKTATRALDRFFSSNGLPGVHWDGNKLVRQMLANLREGRKIFEGYDHRVRVFSDLILVNYRRRVEGNQFFREMLRDYPEAYFILNNRDTDSWIKSREHHAHGRFLEKQLSILGSENPQEAFELWRGEKERHEKAVRDFFAGHDRFLEFDISETNIPGKLEGFLEMRLDYSAWDVVGKTVGQKSPDSRQTPTSLQPISRVES